MLRSWPAIRDMVLFFAGLGGVAHETLASDHSDRPTLLLLFAAMMGLPAFLRADARSGREEAPPPTDEAAKEPSHD